jgi:hypothetical protein
MMIGLACWATVALVALAVQHGGLYDVQARFSIYMWTGVNRYE